MKVLVALFLAVAPTAVSAQTAAAPVATVDPARLVAARRVVDTVFPAAQREAMMSAMVASMGQSTLAAIRQQPDVARLMAAEPRSRPVFERFLQQQQTKTTALIQANIPGMVEAMARAYARRFTATQLADMQTFFETSTGQAYVTQSMTIMSDPDVAAWQAKVTGASITTIGTDVKQFVRELMALAPVSKAER